MSTATDGVTEALRTFNKAIDTVMREPVGPKRWRAANNLWLSLSSKHREIYRAVVADNATAREVVDKHGRAVGLDKGTMADKTFRNSLNIPVGAYTAITKADPNVFKEPKNSALFFKEFREYTTREVY